jgi:hypothetical protein
MYRSLKSQLIGVIDAILTADYAVHRKQRHAAMRIWQQFIAEPGVDGGDSVVRGVKRQSGNIRIIPTSCGR